MEERTENSLEISCAGEEKCPRKQLKWFTITKIKGAVVESNIILIIMSTNVTKSTRGCGPLGVYLVYFG